MSNILETENDKQLFLNHSLCDESENVKLVMNKPVRTGEVVLEPSDWEKKEGLHFGNYSSMRYEDGLFRLWYFAHKRGDKFKRRLCYAESQDGKQFYRPAFDPEVNNGLQPSNSVLSEPVQGGCVWLDPKASPEQRYRSQAKWGPGTGNIKDSGLQFYASPDGLRWHPTHFLSKSEFGDCDTQNVVFFDENYARYVMYTREWIRFDDPNLSHRKVRRLESEDLVHWKNEKIIWEADEFDRSRWATSIGKPPVDYYGACVFKYPDAGDFYVIFPQAFWHWQDRPEEEKWGYSPDPANLKRQIVHLGPAVIDARLGYSRDGINFYHTVDREAFLSTGPDGAFDSRVSWILPEPVIRERDIWFYYAGANRDHDGFVDGRASEQRSGIGRAVLRRDGFVSAEADFRGGWLITPPLTFNSGTLELNVSASAGGAVRVEILDTENQPIAGYSGEDSPWFCGDSVRLPVHWKKVEIGKLAGKTVKLKFNLREAKLYSFQVNNNFCNNF